MGAKLVKLVLGFLFLMHLLHAFQGSPGKPYLPLLIFSLSALVLISSLPRIRVYFKADLKPDEDSPKPVVPKKDNDLEHSPASDPTDLEREMDNLMKHDYPSRMKPRKRSPIHN
uniref:Uncharacterized protein n=1 Tax=Tarenaya spinosa TaxID=228870 RepID=Q1KUZ8_9ROSI|nr:hypothetical protein [Tarenaya spinosa]